MPKFISEYVLQQCQSALGFAAWMRLQLVGDDVG
jgi:hypothetical protein